MPDTHLEHYGVKGMHWGQRKAANAERRELPRHAGYSTTNYALDQKKFGKNGTARINESLSKGSDYASARKAEVSRRRKRNAMIYGGYLAARALYVYGPAVAQTVAQNYVGKKNETAGRKAAADLFSDSRGIGNYKIVDVGYDSKTNSWG